MSAPAFSDDQGARACLESARALAERYDADLGHSARVLAHGRRLLADSLEAFNHPERAEGYALRLDLAAILHDIGRMVAVREHNRYSRYLIAHSDHTQSWPKPLRREVAELARFHRGPARAADLRRRLGADGDLVRLAALLRIADALDRSHVPGVSILSFEHGRKGWSLRVTGLPDKDLRRLSEKKADLFPYAFGSALTVVVDLGASLLSGEEADGAAGALSSRVERT